MRILFLNPSGQLGGAELSLLDLLASLHATEPEWKLALLSGEDGPLLARADALGVQTCFVPFPRAVAHLGDASGGRFSMIASLASSTFPAWRYKRRLADVIRSFAPDVLHTNGFKMHVLGTLARGGRSGKGGSSSLPVVWHVRDFVSSRPVMARLLRSVASPSTSAVANSNAVAEDLRGVVNGRMQVRTVYNGIDLNQFSPTGPTLDLDALAGLPAANSEVVRLGLVATLAFWKGHEVFLRALALLSRKLNFRGYVIGGAIYQTSASQSSLEDLRALVSELGISDRVGFTGQIEDSAAAMRSLDIVVHASTRPEPFGRVIVEAMACGRAVITSGQGGAAEIVTAEVNALIHTAGDARSLADAMTRVVADRELRQKLAKAGQEQARTRFDRGRLAGDMKPVYLELAR